MTENRFMKSLGVLTSNEAQASAAPAPAQETRLLSEVVAKIAPKKSRGVARTFYLSKEVAEALELESKRRKVIRSNIVDEALKRVLLESS